jgi:fucose 4-O-acetylase-like acetyltransferase
VLNAIVTTGEHREGGAVSCHDAQGAQGQTRVIEETHGARRRPAEQPAEKWRTPRWDNARYVAGTLIVLNHMVDMGRFEGLGWLYLVTWAMRVPAFALLAGYFSTADPWRPGRGRTLLLPILVPYLAVGALHTLERRAATGEWRFFFHEPAWTMWFLLSLICWRLALPYLARLRHPLTTSVVAALAVGFLPAEAGGTLQLSRTLAFLPFFLLGWRLREGFLAQPMRAAWSRSASVAVVCVVSVLAWLLRDELLHAGLSMKHPYQEPSGWAIRAAVLLVGAAVTLSFVRLVPARRLPLVTYLGSGGLYIYLLHPPMLRLLGHAGLDFRWAGPWPEQAALLGLAALMSAALASPPVRFLTRPIIQPYRPGRRPAPHRAGAYADREN